MTQKQSQLTFPINTTTLFTSIVGAVIIAFLFYLSDIPDAIEDTQTELKLMKESNNSAIEQIKMDNSEIKNKIEKQWPMLMEHGQRIQRIEDTRFTDKDAGELADRIIKEVKMSVQPVAEQANQNKNDINQLDEDVRAIIRHGGKQ